jgi:hypothetical protein
MGFRFRETDELIVVLELIMMIFCDELKKVIKATENFDFDRM